METGLFKQGCLMVYRLGKAAGCHLQTGPLAELCKDFEGFRKQEFMNTFLLNIQTYHISVNNYSKIETYTLKYFKIKESKEANSHRGKSWCL